MSQDVRRLKIFHVVDDFIVAESAEAALQFYKEMVGELEGDEEVEEIQREDWATMKVVDIDTEGHPEQTFLQAFEDMLTWPDQEYPKVIASSEAWR